MAYSVLVLGFRQRLLGVPLLGLSFGVGVGALAACSDPCGYELLTDDEAAAMGLNEDLLREPIEGEHMFDTPGKGESTFATELDVQVDGVRFYDPAVEDEYCVVQLARFDARVEISIDGYAFTAPMYGSADDEVRQSMSVTTTWAAIEAGEIDEATPVLDAEVTVHVVFDEDGPHLIVQEATPEGDWLAIYGDEALLH